MPLDPVLEEPRCRGADHDHDLRDHVEPADAAERQSRSWRRCARGRPARRARGAKARRAVRALPDAKAAQPGVSRVAAGAGATLAGLFLVALTLRPQIIGAGPLFPAIGDAPVRRTRSWGCSGRSRCSAWVCSHRRRRISRTGSAPAGRSPSAVTLIGVVRPRSARRAGHLAGDPADLADRDRDGPRECARRDRDPRAVRGPAGNGDGVFTTGIQIGSASAAAAAVPLADVVRRLACRAVAVFAFVACLLAVPGSC